MKTPLNLNDALPASAKALAAQQQTSLTRVIEEGLQLRLRAVQPVNKPTARSIPLLNGRGGLVAGLDSTSNKALLDAADDDA